MARRLLLLAAKTAAAALAVTFMAAMLLVWRANQGPIVIDSIAPQLAEMLSNPVTGVRTDIGHAQLMWNRDDQALRLVASAVKVYDDKDHLLAVLPQLALGLNFLAPFYGQLAPIEIFSHNFSLRLTRADEGKLFFGDMALEEAGGGAPGAAGPTDLVSTVRRFLQLDTEWFGLGRIGAIKIGNVQIIVADKTTKTDWATITLSEFMLSRRPAGMKIGAALHGQLGAGAVGDLEVEGDYSRRERQMALRATFSHLNPAEWSRALALPEAYAAADMPLEGSLAAQLDEQVTLQQIVLDVHGGGGKLAVPALWPQSLAVQSMTAKAQINFMTHEAEITETALNIGGVKINATLRAAPRDAQDPAALKVEAQATLKDWPLDRVAELWPPEVAPNPREWIVTHMSGGLFTEVAAEGSWTTRWEAPEAMHDFQLKGKIGLTNATIKYLDGMPPVTGVNATAEADRSSLTIHILGGKADRVVLGPAPIVIAGLDGDIQTIQINLAGKNSVSDVIRLIDQPPLHYARAVGLSPDQVGGMAELDVRLGFPLLKSLPIADMQIDAKAKITDLASDKLVPGLAISKGALELAVDTHKLSMKGRAAYNGVMLDTDYQQFFKRPEGPDGSLQSLAVLHGALTNTDLAGLGLPIGDYIGGAVPAMLRYEKRFTTPAVLQLEADFTPVAIVLPMLGWQKAAQQAADGKIKLVLDKKGPQLKQFTLSGPQLNAVISGTLDDAMQPKTLLCQPCKIGRTDMKLRLDFAGGKLAEVTASGAALDYRSDESDKPDKAEAPPQPIKVKVDLGRLYQDETHSFSNVRGTVRRDTTGWDMIDVRAVAEDRVPVTVALLPQPDGTRKLTIQTDDLGDVLRAADATDQIHGGKLLVTGNSTVKEPYRIMGKIKLKDYRVRRLPFLVVLLNAASITGFADMMGGQGLNFDRLEGGFDWNGYLLGLDDVRTAGGALGLNVEGMLDFGAHRADLRGTVVPFSFVNNIIGNIPIVGDILTGGKGGGLVAATYQAEGPLDKMNVSVNPVSFLTPGILRRIFFQE